MNIFNSLSQQSKAEISIKLVLLDAIERGLTTASQAIEYMKTETFMAAVNQYLGMMGETIEGPLTKYDWSKVPDEINYLATDASGAVCGYINKPILKRNWWKGDTQIFIYWSNESENWQKSLEQRPSILK